eukprot:scaffold7103_cov39-Tisochrysis_lutea.AAC.2
MHELRVFPESIMVEKVDQSQESNAGDYPNSATDSDKAVDLVVDALRSHSLNGGSEVEENKQLVPRQRVRIIGLDKRVDLNGTEGTILHWVDGVSRWAVRCDKDDSDVRVRPENLEVLPSQTSIVASSPSTAVDAMTDSSLRMRALIGKSTNAEDTRWQFSRHISQHWPQNGSHEARFQQLQRLKPQQGGVLPIALVLQAETDSPVSQLCKGQVIGGGILRDLREYASKDVLEFHNNGGHACFMMTVVVDKELRGCGYGKRLTIGLEDAARDRAFEYVYLASEVNGYWMARGYTPLPEHIKPFAGKFPWMRKKI